MKVIKYTSNAWIKRIRTFLLLVYVCTTKRNLICSVHVGSPLWRDRHTLGRGCRVYIKAKSPYRCSSYNFCSLFIIWLSKLLLRRSGRFTPTWWPSYPNVGVKRPLWHVFYFATHANIPHQIRNKTHYLYWGWYQLTETHASIPHKRLVSLQYALKVRVAVLPHIPL